MLEYLITSYSSNYFLFIFHFYFGLVDLLVCIWSPFAVGETFSFFGPPLLKQRLGGPLIFDLCSLRDMWNNVGKHLNSAFQEDRSL